MHIHLCYVSSFFTNGGGGPRGLQELAHVHTVGRKEPEPKPAILTLHLQHSPLMGSPAGGQAGTLLTSHQPLLVFHTELCGGMSQGRGSEDLL